MVSQVKYMLTDEELEQLYFTKKSKIHGTGLFSPLKNQRYMAPVCFLAIR